MNIFNKLFTQRVMKVVLYHYLMAKNITFRRLATLLLIFISVSLNAQINNSDYRVTLTPEDLGTCGGANNSNEVVVIKAKKNTLHDFSITFDLPEGVSFVPGTESITVNPGANYTLTYDAGTPVTNPKFIIRNTAGGAADANWALADELTFVFEREAACDAVGYKEAGGVFKDKHTIDYQDSRNNVFRTASDLDENTSTYDLLSASISIQDIDPLDGVISSVAIPIYHSRDIIDVQGGNGEVQVYHHEVTIESSIHDYTLNFNGSVLTPTSVAGGVYTYDIDLTQAPFNVATANEDGNGQFENGETFSFQESFAVIDCANVNIYHKSYWGCSGSVCQTSGLESGAVLLGNQMPILSITRLEGGNDICNTNHTRVRITNSSTDAGATGKDVYINIGLGHNNSYHTNYDSNPFWAFDFRDRRRLTNVHFTGGPATITTYDNPSSIYPTWGSGTSIAIPPDFLTTDPDGAGVGLEDLDQDGYYDDLAPGESTVIEFDIDYNPRDNCGVGHTDYINWEHIYFDVNIKNQCLEPKDSRRIDLGYKNLIRDYLRVTEFGGETDIVDGQQFTACITPAMYSNIKLNGHNALSSNADSEFSVTITVPDGVTLDAAAPNAGDFTTSGNIITYSTTNLDHYPRVLEAELDDGKLCFPLVFDCNDYTASNSSSVFSIEYTTHLTLLDAGGNACYDHDIHCGTMAPIQTHGCFSGCNGPAITKFDANRISAGWTDNSMTTRVDLSTAATNGYELKKYLVGDTMKIETKAIMHSYTTTNLHIRVKYTTDGSSLGADDIEYLNGTISVYDSSTGITTAVQDLAGVTPTVTSSGNDHEAEFDISDFRTLFDNDNFSSNDSIFVNLNYRFNLNQNQTILHTLANFRGRYYSEDVTGEVSCDIWGDRASYLRVGKHIGKYIERFQNCQTGVLRAWASEYANAGDLHPNEYRPPYGFQEAKVTMPTGYRFTGRAEMRTNQGTYTIANGGLTFTQSGNDVFLYPTANFRNDDQSNTHYPSILVFVKGTCAADEDGSVRFEAKYNEYHYGANAPLRTLVTNRPLDYTKPTFLLQPASSIIIDGDSPEANFDLNITNTSMGSGSIDYNWIKVNPASGITIVGANDITGGGNTALNIVQSGGYTWVEIGSIAIDSEKDIRIRATYDDCAPQDVTFAHSWDCTAYPTVAEYLNQTNICYSDPVQLRLEPRTSEVQMEITEQPVTAVDMCDPFHIKLKINSAQLAYLIDPSADLILPAGLSSLDVNSIKLRYPYDAATAETVTYTTSGNIIHIDLSQHTTLNSLGGIPGTNSASRAEDRQVEVDFELKTTCDYISGTSVLLAVYANMPCGDSAIGNAASIYSNNIDINSLEQAYDAFSDIVLPGNTAATGAHIDGCNTTETITVNTTISDITGQPAANTGSADFANINLPSGITYVNGSFASTSSVAW